MWQKMALAFQYVAPPSVSRRCPPLLHVRTRRRNILVILICDLRRDIAVKDRDVAVKDRDVAGGPRLTVLEMLNVSPECWWLSL